MALPKTLKAAPIVDAIFELRFVSTVPNLGELLPGMLSVASLGIPNAVQPLPFSRIPREIRAMDPALRHQALYRFADELGRVDVGPNVLNVGYSAYPGWSAFKQRITAVLNWLNSQNIQGFAVERFSFRYVNLIERDANSQLASLSAHFELAGKPVPELGFQLRTEIHQHPYVSIVQINTNAEGSMQGRSRRGILVDVDVVRNIAQGYFWPNLDALLEEGHQQEKTTFFSLLTPATIASLQPEYEKTSG